MARRWSRREVLGTAAGFALGGGLAACASSGSTSATTTPTTTPPSPATTAAATSTVASTTSSTTTSSTTTTSTVAATTTTAAPARSLRDVEHIVIFFQENRSFDHLFGWRRDARGWGDPAAASVWTQPLAGGRTLLPYHLDTATTAAACVADPDHSWAGMHAAWNGGKLDGFGRRMGPPALGYHTRADIPYYAALADAFTLCDGYFSSVLGPTTPNRLYSMGATIDAAGAGGGPVTENLVGPFDWTTYPERLQAAGISWRVYHEQDDYDDNPLKFFRRFQGLSESDPLFDAAIRNRPAGAFADDVAKGDLPQVSWIVAPTARSEHPSFPIAVGEDMTAGILAALMAKPDVWATTLFILSYDENGGFFDHVVPPTAPPGTAGEIVDGVPIGLGFRVPTTIVSPWSRGGRVCSDVFDHTSTLRLLEARFGVEVPNLTDWRRATCGDLTSALDFTTYDPSVPSLPSTADRAAAMLSSCESLPVAAPPAEQVPPTVE